MMEMIEYEAPQVVVCGAFFVECAVAAVSVLTAGITQEGWVTTEVILGEVDSEGGDLWLGY
jgi:hypothetical protein